MKGTDQLFDRVVLAYNSLRDLYQRYYEEEPGVGTPLTISEQLAMICAFRRDGKDPATAFGKQMAPEYLAMLIEAEAAEQDLHAWLEHGPCPPVSHGEISLGNCTDMNLK
jgi:hypothetical protein